MTYPEFKARYALTPDPQQEAAILRAEGPTLLLAVPGSGKTTTLVTRLSYLIHCLGVEPGRILTVTYTVAAAGDMKRRFAALFGEEHAGALAFRTINGICQSIISYYAWAKGAEPFALWTNEGELNALVRWLMQSHGAEWPGEQEVKEGDQHPSERGHGGELIRSSAEFARSSCGMSSPGLGTPPEGT